MIGREALGLRMESWLAGAVDRQAPLVFRDLRKGAQALSARYVEKRGATGALEKALDSPARRGAFATYYAGLHLIQSYLCAERQLGWESVRRIVDLGAGTGAAGFGTSLALAAAPPVEAIDRSGWALAEARAAGRDLGVRVRTRRQDLGRGLPRFASEDGIVAGWFLNELPERARAEAVERLAHAAEGGSRLLIIEPLAGAAAPWWSDVATRLGVPSIEVRERFALPGWIRDMDKAAGLDHGELRVRAMGHLQG